MERLTARKWVFVIASMSLLLVLAIIVCSLIGPTPLDLRQALDSSLSPNPQARILFGIRLPRILLAALIGLSETCLGWKLAARVPSIV